MAYCLSIELHAHVSSGPLGSQLLVEHCDNLAEFEQSSWFICWLSANTEGSRYYVANSDGGPDVSFVLCLVRACKHWYSFIMSSIVCVLSLLPQRGQFFLWIIIISSNVFGAFMMEHSWWPTFNFSNPRCACNHRASQTLTPWLIFYLLTPDCLLGELFTNCSFEQRPFHAYNSNTSSNHQSTSSEHQLHIHFICAAYSKIPLTGYFECSSPFLLYYRRGQLIKPWLIAVIVCTTGQYIIAFMCLTFDGTDLRQHRKGLHRNSGSKTVTSTVKLPSIKQ